MPETIGQRLKKEREARFLTLDKASEATRIRFVTEGILLRWLQDDPTLADVGVLLFDERITWMAIAGMALIALQPRAA